MTREWTRTPMANEVSVSVLNGSFFGFIGIIDYDNAMIYVKRGFSLITQSEIKETPKARTSLVGIRQNLTEELLRKCKARGVSHFIVLAIPPEATSDAVIELKQKASKAYEESLREQKRSNNQKAEDLPKKAQELVELYHLYISLLRRVEGEETPIEEAVQAEQLDPEIAQRLIQYRNTVEFLESVFREIVTQRFNGQNGIVDAYNEIPRPNHEQARKVINTALLISEIAYRCRSLGIYFEIDEVAGLAIAAIFMNSALWNTKNCANHEQESAQNYELIRKHMPKLPEVDDLIRFHSCFCPTNNAYVVDVITKTGKGISATEEVKRRIVHTGIQDNSQAIEIQYEDAISLVTIKHDQCVNVSVYPIDLETLAMIILLYICEFVIENEEQKVQITSTLNQLAKKILIPKTIDEEEGYSLEKDLAFGTSLYARILSAVAQEYSAYPPGTIIEFHTMEIESNRSDPAQTLALNGGIAISVSSNPPLLWIFGHENLPGEFLEDELDALRLTKPQMGANSLPKQRVVNLDPTNKRIFCRRGTVIGIIDLGSLNLFLRERQTRIRKILEQIKAR